MLEKLVQMIRLDMVPVENMFFLLASGSSPWEIIPSVGSREGQNPEMSCQL